MKYFVFLLLFASLNLFSQERANIIVSKDGSGDFKSINEAVASIPKTNSDLIVVLVKDGIYNEKVYIETSNVAIVGESRENTIIRFPELRKNWVKTEGNTHYGSAVVNIKEGTENITLANMTIHNNYGDIFGDHDHQFTIYGKGTKIIIIYCDVIAGGADTISLWPDEGGMFYHSNCYFEGWVDFVCPRGWCYITDSKFYSYSNTAALWHKGIDDKSAKFVIENSFFDGVENFPLGRHHYDAQFYLVDCVFSENMADIPIFWPESKNAHVWEWGSRHYYYDCKRVGHDYDWYDDNITDSPEVGDPEEVDAKWTFGGRWDPEAEMPSVLPFSFLPKPANGSYFNTTDTVLTWVPSRNAESFKVYFWKSKYPQALEQGEKLKTGNQASGEPVFVGDQEEASFNPGKLEKNSTYYWRIDEVIDGEVVEGPLWHFTVRK